MNMDMGGSGDGDGGQSERVAGGYLPQPSYTIMDQQQLKAHMEAAVREEAERQDCHCSPAMLERMDAGYPPQPSFTVDLRPLKVGRCEFKPALKLSSAWNIRRFEHI